MKILFNGKDKEVIELHKSIGYTESASGTKYYYVKCPVSGEWMFRNPKAWESLLKKHRNNLDDIANHTISNEAKRQMNGKPSKKTSVKATATTTTTTEAPKKKVANKVEYVKVANGKSKLEPRGINDQMTKVSWVATDL